MWDPTAEKAVDLKTYANFNPRVPCGTRREFSQTITDVLAISIHGSRVGPDDEQQTSADLEDAFQSTGPVWDPTTVGRKNSTPKTFQSTGPVWDPT